MPPFWNTTCSTPKIDGSIPARILGSFVILENGIEQLARVGWPYGCVPSRIEGRVGKRTHRGRDC